jgi:hypothetical protein
MGAAALGLVQLGWLPWALLAPLVLGALAVAYVLHQVSARHAAPPRAAPHHGRRPAAHPTRRACGRQPTHPSRRPLHGAPALSGRRGGAQAWMACGDDRRHIVQPRDEPAPRREWRAPPPPALWPIAPPPQRRADGGAGGWQDGGRAAAGGGGGAAGLARQGPPGPRRAGCGATPTGPQAIAPSLQPGPRSASGSRSVAAPARPAEPI